MLFSGSNKKLQLFLQIFTKFSMIRWTAQWKVTNILINVKYQFINLLQEGNTQLLLDIGCVDPLKKLASGPNGIAAKYAGQTLRLIGQEVPHKLSQQVPTWYVLIMALPFMKFQEKGYKIRKKSTYPKKIIEFWTQFWHQK